MALQQVSSFSHALSNIKVGHLVLKNRLIMSAMQMNFEEGAPFGSDAYWAIQSAFYGARARGGVGLITCGGFSPSVIGKYCLSSPVLNSTQTAKKLKTVVDAIHNEGSSTMLQILHCGRTTRTPIAVSASSKKYRFNPYPKLPLIRIPSFAMRFIVREYVRCAALARMAGFDGVEVCASEGSLLHNFLSSAFNDRTDSYGGPIENRMLLLKQILEAIRESVPASEKFMLSCRVCVHDVLEQGNTMADIESTCVSLAKSGVVDLITTSVGHPDSPLCVTGPFVPSGTFASIVGSLRKALTSKGVLTPIAASHRIHTVQDAEKLLKDGLCDMVAMARPFLADPNLVLNAMNGEPRETTTPCISCNHCLDAATFGHRVCCAVNPFAGFELERLPITPASRKKSIAVVGAGGAGITCALTLSRRGHRVVLFEKSNEIGGQINLAKLIPGKEEYFRILEHWTYLLRNSAVRVKMKSPFGHEDITKGQQQYDNVVLCTGSLPRPLTSHKLIGGEGKMCCSFIDILQRKAVAGRKVVIIGHGAIAFDVASFLLHDQRVPRDAVLFCDEFGIDRETGQLDLTAPVLRNQREVVLLQSVSSNPTLSPSQGFHLKHWIRKHEGTIIWGVLFHKVGPGGAYFTVSQSQKRSQDCVYQADTFVFANGMLPNVSVGSYICDWVVDGTRPRGQLQDDFGVYAAGSGRDAWTGAGHGEQDLRRCVDEGYQLGMKL